MNYAYLVRCSDDSLYAGWTNDIEKRVRAHNNGTGAKYTKARRPVTLAYAERFETRSEAMKREAALKKLSHSQKEALAGAVNLPALLAAWGLLEMAEAIRPNPAEPGPSRNA